VISEFTNQLAQSMLGPATNLKSEQSVADEQDSILQTMGKFEFWLFVSEL
jgi:hypothetical protein